MQEEISSTNQFGTPDLDLRPPEMMRSTMSLWVKKCPHCEYINTTIDAGLLTPEQFKDLKGTDDWQRTSSLCSGLQMAENFAKFALILQKENSSPFQIAQQYLRAAWAADDERQADLSKALRSMAAEYFEKEIALSDELDQINNSEFILIDVLRRSSRFDKCEKIIERLENENLQGIFLDLLKFQKALVSSGDDQPHLLSELKDNQV